jgi:predicted nucleotide-binding protein
MKSTGYAVQKSGALRPALAPRGGVRGGRLVGPLHVSPAGIPTVTRLEEMLVTAKFAFLIMTADDEQKDGSFTALQNVVHEAELFQGRLGFNKAIILLEEKCQDFSNIRGLTDIPFPEENIKAAFEDVRRVFAREGVISGD